MKIQVTRNKVEHRTRDLVIGLISFFGFATILLVIFFINKQIPENYVEIDGVIDHFDYEYDNTIAFVNYTYNNINYTNRLDSYSSTMYVGKIVTFFLNPDNPNDITMNGTTFSQVLILVSSFLFYLVSIYLLVMLIRKKQNKEPKEIKNNNSDQTPNIFKQLD